MKLTYGETLDIKKKFYGKPQEILQNNYLNDSYCLGSCIDLINKFFNKWDNLDISKGGQDLYESWEEFYFNSGESWEDMINEMDDSETMKPILVPKIKSKRDYKFKEFFKANYNFGRSKRMLDYIGGIYYNEILKADCLNNITLEDCQQKIYFHAIYETFIGYISEVKMINDMRGKYPTYKFEKTNAYTDSVECIDYFVVNDENVKICGLQLKPQTFFIGDSQHLVDSRKKHIQFSSNCKNKYGCPLAYNTYYIENEGLKAFPDEMYHFIKICHEKPFKLSEKVDNNGYLIK